MSPSDHSTLENFIQTRSTLKRRSWVGYWHANGCTPSIKNSQNKRNLLLHDRGEDITAVYFWDCPDTIWLSIREIFEGLDYFSQQTSASSMTKPSSLLSQKGLELLPSITWIYVVELHIKTVWKGIQRRILILTTLKYCIMWCYKHIQRCLFIRLHMMHLMQHPDIITLHLSSDEDACFRFCLIMANSLNLIPKNIGL